MTKSRMRSLFRKIFPAYMVVLKVGYDCVTCGGSHGVIVTYSEASEKELRTAWGLELRDEMILHAKKVIAEDLEEKSCVFDLSAVRVIEEKRQKRT